MKTFEFNKRTVLLLVIMLWNIISIVFYWIPYLSEISKFIDDIKYEIIGGYVNKPYLEKNIYGHMFLGTMSIICTLFLFIMCILSYKKRRMTKYVGIGIIMQTFMIILLKIWNDNLVDDYNGTEVISLKYWLIISIIVSIGICFVYVLYNKISFVILFISSILQIINAIEFFKLNIGFLTQESIANLNYLSIVFQCTSGVTLYILYWILFIDSTKTQ